MKAFTRLVFAAVIGLASISAFAVDVGTCPTVASSDATVKNFTVLTGNQSVNYGSNGLYNRDINDAAAVFSNPPNYLYPRQSVAWPANIGNIAYISIPANKYETLKFTVPVGYFAQFSGKTVYHQYSLGETGFSSRVGMTLSSTCGDFSNPASNPTSTVGKNCWKNNMGPDSSLAITNNNVANGMCLVQEGKTYYLNVINADISGVTAGGGSAKSTSLLKTAVGYPKCPNGVCSDPVANGPGSFKGPPEIRSQPVKQ